MSKLTLNEIKNLLNYDDEDLFSMGYTKDNIYDENEAMYNSSDDDDENFEPEIVRKEKCEKNKISVCKVEAIMDSTNAYEEAPNDILLNTPFSYLLIAKPGSGKSTLLINMLKWYKGYFDEIFIWSPTFKIDNNWTIAMNQGIIDVPKENIFKKYNENKLKKIFNEIKKKNKGVKNYDEKVKTLFIFDDIIGELPRQQKGYFNNISRNHRHFGISHITISQEYKAVSPTFRKNIFGVCLWNSGNTLERKAIIEEVGGTIGMNRFERIWNYAVSGSRYDFLYIRQFEHDERKKYYKNFEESINPYQFSNDKIQLTENKLDKGIEKNEDTEDETDNMEVLFKLLNKNKN